MIFFTDTTIATDERAMMMANVAATGNSGVLVGVVVGELELVGVVEGNVELDGELVGVVEAPMARAVTELAVSVWSIRLDPDGL